MVLSQLCIKLHGIGSGWCNNDNHGLSQSDKSKLNMKYAFSIITDKFIGPLYSRSTHSAANDQPPFSQVHGSSEFKLSPLRHLISTVSPSSIRSSSLARGYQPFSGGAGSLQNPTKKKKNQSVSFFMATKCMHELFHNF